LIDRFNRHCTIGKEFVLLSLEDRVAQFQSCLPNDYCRKHRYLTMLHTYQRLAWQELRRNILLACHGRLPAELTDVIFEEVVQGEKVSLNPCVFVRVNSEGAPLVGDIVRRGERYSVNGLRKRRKK